MKKINVPQVLHHSITYNMQVIWKCRTFACITIFSLLSIISYTYESFVAVPVCQFYKLIKIPATYFNWSVLKNLHNCMGYTGNGQKEIVSMPNLMKIKAHKQTAKSNLIKA